MNCQFCGSEMFIISNTPNRGNGVMIPNAAWWECTPCDTGFLYLNNSGKLLQTNFYHRIPSKCGGFHCFIVSQHQDSGITEFKEFKIWGDDKVIVSQDRLPSLTPGAAVAKLKFILLFS
jgi:hypothetical protein